MSWPGRGRRSYANYLDLVVQRDVLGIRRIRQRSAMPVLLRRLVAQTGQLLNIARASGQADLERSVGEDYTRLLEAVFLVHRVPAWGTTLGARVNSLPKVHVVDTGLGGWLLGIRGRGIERRDPTVLGQFGHLLETFAVNEVAIEIKSGEKVRTEDLRGLAALRDRLGSTFRAGVVLHPGPMSVPLGDRIYALPLDRLWTAGPSSVADEYRSSSS